MYLIFAGLKQSGLAINLLSIRVELNATFMNELKKETNLYESFEYFQAISYFDFRLELKKKTENDF